MTLCEPWQGYQVYLDISRRASKTTCMQLRWSFGWPTKTGVSRSLAKGWRRLGRAEIAGATPAVGPAYIHTTLVGRTVYLPLVGMVCQMLRARQRCFLFHDVSLALILSLLVTLPLVRPRRIPSDTV
ncbi:hypothetical protein FA95DRAFT_786182 [Auriscalpium vulgare]|uniref:Uncharacterized protein n=1 Tax=Auriscalpium vulgare TaxID=40419 RepID=A0ACB8RA96_9AGAM|nr:hypothetical protein FA95DRAFT_786182 [Auriscalpium vulgare]